MRIGIPVDENNKDSKISVSFGRGPWFAIVDTENDEYNFVENTGAESSGGAGIKAAQILLDNKIEALLTVRCGENAAEVLKTEKIKIHKVESLIMDKNIESFKRGTLPELMHIHGGFHGNGERK